MQQLSGIDSFMLHSERENVYNHVGMLGLYDPSTGPGGRVRFKEILRHVEAHLDDHPLFRRRLVQVPLGMDRPYWIDGQAVDLEFHVRHIALPEPGDWRQLMIQVARIHSRPLDRSRPLWEMYVIEGLSRIPGLPHGAFAVQHKYHHASVDGFSAGALIMGLHSNTPQMRATRAARNVVAVERELAPLQMYTKALRQSVRRTAGLSSLGAQTAARLAGVTVAQFRSWLHKAEDGADAAPSLPDFVRAPQTRFSGKVSAHRALEAVPLPMAELKRVRARLPDATINDLFLTIVGGALHRYLRHHGELPAQSLIALMPISLRAPGGDGKPAGNQVGGVPVAIHSEIGKPLERLAACQRDSGAAKAGAEVMGRDFLQTLLDDLPNGAAEAFMRHLVLPQLNTVVSNVRGPETMLHFAGARLVHCYPLSIASDGVGLNHTGFSYNGVLWISAVACRNMMPDPGFYADCLRASFIDLIGAADARSAIDDAKAKPPRRRAKPARAARKAPDAMRRE